MDISLEQPAVLRLKSVVGLVLEQVVVLRLEIVAEFIGIRNYTTFAAILCLKRAGRAIQ